MIMRDWTLPFNEYDLRAVLDAQLKRIAELVMSFPGECAPPAGAKRKMRHVEQQLADFVDRLGAEETGACVTSI